MIVYAIKCMCFHIICIHIERVQYSWHDFERKTRKLCDRCSLWLAYATKVPNQLFAWSKSVKINYNKRGEKKLLKCEMRVRTWMVERRKRNNNHNKMMTNQWIECYQSNHNHNNNKIAPIENVTESSNHRQTRYILFTLIKLWLNYTDNTPAMSA